MHTRDKHHADCVGHHHAHAFQDPVCPGCMPSQGHATLLCACGICCKDGEAMALFGIVVVAQLHLHMEHNVSVQIGHSLEEHHQEFGSLDSDYIVGSDGDVG